MNLNHLYLRVRDLERSTDFYASHFGFDGPSEWQGETCVIRNDEGFALALTPDAAPPAWPRGLHFGFLLESVERVLDLHTRLRDDGIEMIEACFEPAFGVFRCLDPDGYVVEVEAGVPAAPPP